MCFLSDLFEVVDRKAKHVADELSEEQQIASQSSGIGQMLFLLVDFYFC